MIAEDLKKALGEDLSKQVEEALKGKGKDGKDLDCVVGNDGSYVPAKKYDDMKNDYDTAKKEADTLRASQKSIQDEYENYKKGSITQADYDAKVKEIQEEADNKIKQNNFDNKLDFALISKYGAKDAKEVRPHLDVSKISLDGENFIGLEEQMTNLTKDKDYLFNKKETVITGPEGGRDKIPDDDKKADLDKMTYSEMLDYMEKNPEAKI